MRNLHHSLCGVIPPHVLRNIADRGNAEARRDAQATLDHMEDLSDARHSAFAAQALPVTRPNLKRRNVYDARQTQILPGKLVRDEHRRRSNDVEVNEAYDGSGATYDFFASVFGRNSVDGQGLRIDSTVHYGRRFDNAMWTGRQMVYGDGDGQFFNRFTCALDVIAHELTHGVTQYSAGLGYTGQTGAINEHISDAFGMMVKQFALGLSAGESDWLIGAGLFGPAVQGKAIRSMAEPGTAYDDPLLGRDPQPAHMKDYQHGKFDSGGVHINSGIPNHAFYLAATALGGYTWEVLGRIWYAALTMRLPGRLTFDDFAGITVNVAGELYGPRGGVQRAVQDAWAAVGLPVTPTRIPVARMAVPEGAVTTPPVAAVHGQAKWRNRPANN